MAEMTMVERVATAIMVADVNITAKTYPAISMKQMADSLQKVVEKGHYDAMARAAIEAMLEPSAAMISAGIMKTHEVPMGNGTSITVPSLSEYHRPAYYRMIEAALNEEVAG